LVKLAQPSDLALVVVAGNTDAHRKVGEDIDVVATLIHRFDRLAHVDRIVPRAGPRRVHVVALPEGSGRENDIRIAGRGCQEMILRRQELDAAERADYLVDIGGLIEKIAADRIDHLDVRRIAASLAAHQ
jgi:hypothetical protein